MRYWTYFIGKLLAAAVLFWLALRGMAFVLPEPETFLRQRVTRFPQDLVWTSALFFLGLCAVGVLFLIVWDQQRRCRVCLRRLRMPVESGSWSEATLFSPPKTAMICPYGHGTLHQPEVHTSGAHSAEWQEHGDIWTELEEIDRGRR